MNDIAMEPEKAPSASALVADLTDLLDVEQLDRDLYRGHRKKGGVGRIFGGQVIAQAVMSASLSIEDDKTVHSLHAYFMRPGDENLPIIFRVERDFDGGSFANRRVIAMQNGKAILNLISSFQRKEEGLSHMAPMPQVPPPESLMSLLELAQKHGGELLSGPRTFMQPPGAIELRPVIAFPSLSSEKMDPANQCWFKAIAPVRDDPRLHQAMLAHASDMVLLSTSLLPHGINGVSHNIQTASLDHALWFHEDVTIDDWLLYVMDSPWAGHARGFNRGAIYTREGKLVASVAQEGLIRIRT
ncbi:acyl-CoA thioesterase [Rhizorhapis sp. SPR117]|uniref:acyl-CoA thioesterase n=1 Tax=Rhizorhapis sp. SPR117 TaxID=2912611 RepID=UPI001F234C5C|nr:acyl-CoA thioesterase II [Rhizorhapis sp. SPR117]